MPDNEMRGEAMVIMQESSTSGILADGLDHTKARQKNRHLRLNHTSNHTAIAKQETQTTVTPSHKKFRHEYEELLTSKEELQSLNEELTALNNQLHEALER